VVALVDRRPITASDHLIGVPDDLRHEPTGVLSATLDIADLRLPFAGHLGALQRPVLLHGYEILIQVCREQ
jgi:hypothetical protein